MKSTPPSDFATDFKKATMRLMRNTTPDGSCKYAAIRMDKINNPALPPHQYDEAMDAIATLGALGVLENPKKGDPEEFLLIKLKDVNAEAAFDAYSGSVWDKDPEFGRDVAELAVRSRRDFKRKDPD